ncbi:vesicle transport protein USE1 isoform X2 [Zootermopsis nevadensis]|uniref:Vesicle transport protein USE1 n=2 Tax=Zootermopsis nevadensis TaxID=136037 RepID=A0A067QMR0_ZOONE|nr:vesicle transport protein USE1 isoform X2 [Zootermopsis nevadensis]XP_021935821.1 vesicle transport protein USE1 isoform X2 [Zootermopsis nevadensis]XP_021935822.1 vesicle transport protein USE1 isoform X2 [Zootermopsis nevadensis]XP_021935823.1 vesicle transport protein USE1 isoform X2 [Zootermopsis nevadensis]XP_021935824.1 vesicle transport protein USE1 isoform X2 [Zootermopsis nevadensis]KDR10759.1 Vesicle transport protein USE1 [Zootermopsis nevadensis]
MMGMSKLEVNLRRLLSQCENMAKEDPQKDWRLDKYIGALDEMVTNLQKLPNKPSKDTMAEYIRRVLFLKGIIETHKLTNPAEKIVAVQLVPHGPATSSEAVTKEIHQTTASKYAKELREQLLQNGSGSDKNLRQRKQKSGGEDLDALIKYHHSMQEKIADDMLLLARNLKEQSQLAGSIIRRDTETVGKSSNMADHNFARLKVESERLEEHSRRACKCWIWVMVAAVVIIFINMVLFMKIMKKKS